MTRYKHNVVSGSIRTVQQRDLKHHWYLVWRKHRIRMFLEVADIRFWLDIVSWLFMMGAELSALRCFPQHLNARLPTLSLHVWNDRKKRLVRLKKPLAVWGRIKSVGCLDCCDDSMRHASSHTWFHYTDLVTNASGRSLCENTWGCLSSSAFIRALQGFALVLSTCLSSGHLVGTAGTTYTIVIMLFETAGPICFL